MSFLVDFFNTRLLDLTVGRSLLLVGALLVVGFAVDALLRRYDKDEL